MCLFGAVNKADHGHADYAACWYDSAEQFYAEQPAAVRAVIDAAGGFVLSKRWGGTTLAGVEINNAPETTFADIKGILCRAIDAARKAEGEAQVVVNAPVSAVTRAAVFAATGIEIVNPVSTGR